MKAPQANALTTISIHDAHNTRHEPPQMKSLPPKPPNGFGGAPPPPNPPLPPPGKRNPPRACGGPSPGPMGSYLAPGGTLWKAERGGHQQTRNMRGRKGSGFSALDTRRETMKYERDRERVCVCVDEQRTVRRSHRLLLLLCRQTWDRQT